MWIVCRREKISRNIRRNSRSFSYYMGTFAPITNPHHLLWTLLFLKSYSTETIHAIIAMVDEKTFRHYIWHIINEIAALNLVCYVLLFTIYSCILIVQISWESRLQSLPFENCYCSVDGVDFSILEPIPFDPKWLSHEFKSVGLRYEVFVSLDGGIVWFHGQFECGHFPDVNIFNLGLKQSFLENEKVVGDQGYRDAKFLNVNHVDGENAATFASIRARHEILYKLMGHFSVLSQTFRHPREKHGLCFQAVFN